MLNKNVSVLYTFIFERDFSHDVAFGRNLEICENQTCSYTFFLKSGKLICFQVPRFRTIFGDVFSKIFASICSC